MIFGRRAAPHNDVATPGAHPGPVRDNIPPAMHVSRTGGKQAALQVEAMPYVQTNDDPLAVGGPIPPSIGRVADLYAATRQLRLQMEKEVEPIQARETQLREYIINNLSKSDDTGAAGLQYRAQIVMKDVPRPANWDLIHKYIRDNGRFDLVQRRLSDKAIKDMIEAGEVIPGIEVAHIPDVSITKIGR